MKRKEPEVSSSTTTSKDVGGSSTSNNTSTNAAGTAPPDNRTPAREAGELPQKMAKQETDTEASESTQIVLPAHLSELESAFSTIDTVISAASFKGQIPFSKVQDGALRLRNTSVTERQLLQIKRVWPESFVLKRSTGPKSADTDKSSIVMYSYSRSCYAVPNALRRRAGAFRQHLLDYTKAFFTEYNIPESEWLKSADAVPRVEPVPLLDIPGKGGSNKNTSINASKAGMKIGFEPTTVTAAATTSKEMTTPPSHGGTSPPTPGGDCLSVKGIDMEVLQKINSIERQRSEALKVRKTVHKEDILGTLPQVVIALRQAYFSERKNVAPLSEAAQRLSRLLVPAVTQNGAEARLRFLAEAAPELVTITKPPPPPPIFDAVVAATARRQRAQTSVAWVRWCKILPANTTDIFNRILSTPETSELYVKHFGPVTTGTEHSTKHLQV